MPTDSRDLKDTIRQYLDNLQREADSVALYRALSVEERKPEIAEVYKRLAAIEQAHKDFWNQRLSELGHQMPESSVGWRTRILIRLARRHGPDFVLPVVSTREQADVGHYDAQSEAIAGGFSAAEKSHARIIRAVAASMPNMSIGPLANALRAAVLGANDGLASNLSLVMGVSGANLASHAILITGLSGLVAGACAMAMGEWLSVTTSRESHEPRVDVEAREPADISDEEREHLANIYSAHGFRADEARALADRLATPKARKPARLCMECGYVVFSFVCSRRSVSGDALLFRVGYHSRDRERPNKFGRAFSDWRGSDTLHRAKLLFLRNSTTHRWTSGCGRDLYAGSLHRCSSIKLGFPRRPAALPLGCVRHSKRLFGPARRVLFRAPQSVLLADGARAQEGHVTTAQHQVPIQPRQPVALQKPGVITLR